MRSACFGLQKVMDPHLFIRIFKPSTKIQHKFRLTFEDGTKNIKHETVIHTLMKTVPYKMAKRTQIEYRQYLPNISRCLWD